MSNRITRTYKLSPISHIGIWIAGFVVAACALMAVVDFVKLLKL